MSVTDVVLAIRNMEFFTAIRESALVYPIIMSLHLGSIAIFGGLILMTDLRLLGLAMNGVSITEIVGSTRVLKRIGFVIMVSCGIMLAGSKLETYYGNPYFQLKLTLLTLVGVHGLIFRRSVYRNTAQLDAVPSPPRIAKVAACTSLILWLAVLSAGRWIAYFEPPATAIVASSHAAVPSE